MNCSAGRLPTIIFRHDGSDEPPGKVLYPHDGRWQGFYCHPAYPSLHGPYSGHVVLLPRQEKAVLFFEMDPAVADSLQRAIVSGGWGNRQRLAVRLVCAFCCGAGVTLNNLSMELAAGEVFRRPEGYLIHTYVSNYQYVFLKETAAAQRMSVEGMLTAAAELLVGTDDEGSGYHIPESLGRIADRVFEVRGSTLKDFRRQCLVSIRTNTIGSDRIAAFMEKHGIASAREFLRRVVLFFLEARYLIYRKEVELDEDDLPEEEETDWEETMYSQYQKRDFAISTYNY